MEHVVKKEKEEVNLGKQLKTEKQIKGEKHVLWRENIILPYKNPPNLPFTWIIKAQSIGFQDHFEKSDTF